LICPFRGGGCGCAHAENKPTRITDPKGNVTHFDYDQEWQLLSITDPAGHTTRWTYDAAGNRQTQTDANGHTYRWVYDSRNRVLAETNAVGQVTTFAYDAAGNRTNRVNGAGEVTFWNYDALNRVTGKLARYYASISYWDEHVGRVVAALKEAGQFDNTIFIVAGDNGLSLGEHGLLGKQNLYEFGGMHVPLIFAGPGIKKGETKALAYLYEVYPTLCELAGIPVPAGLDAKSLAPVIRGERAKVRDYLFTAYKNCQRSLRDDRWKLIRYPLINKTQLFDLQADPHELNDLAGCPENTEKIKELLAVLEAEQQRYGDPAPLTVPDPKPAAWTPSTTRKRWSER
jgi:YD repeat-containing protein